MAKDTLYVGIIGCGRVAGHHARSLREVPGARLAAVCDLVDGRATALAKDHGVAPYRDYHEMLSKHPEIELVAVVTPSGMHFEHAMDVIDSHGRSVVVEKPPVMRLSEGEALARAAERKGLRVFPVFQYRFNKSVQRVRRAVLEGELGRLALGTIRLRWCRPQRYYDRDPWRGTFALDGGACTNQGIHHLDLLRYLAGEVRRVNARMRTFGAKIEVEDTVTATLEFESGALGVVEITTAARPDDFESSISFLGDKGLAMVGGWATNELTTFSPDPAQQQAHSETFPDVYGFGHREIYRGALAALRAGAEPAVRFDDAMRSVALLHALYLSDETGVWVEVAKGRESARLGLPDQRLMHPYRTPALARP